MSFARSVMISDAMQNSLGHGEPPKVSHRLSNAMSPIVMMYLAAVSPCSVILRYAPFKSVFAMSIFVSGRCSCNDTM